MNDIEDLVAPYVLGALSSDERLRFEAHLIECVECSALVEEYSEGLVSLDRAMATEPPPELRGRVLADLRKLGSSNVIEIRPKGGSVWRLAVVAAAALIVFLGGLTLINPDPLAEVMAAADARTVELAVHDAFDAPPPPQAAVIFSATEGAAAVEFAGLAPPDEGTTYQLWLIADGQPLPAGVFVPDEEGEATVLLQGEAESGHLVAITQEPAGGLAAPSGEVLFSAGL